MRSLAFGVLREIGSAFKTARYNKDMTTPPASGPVHKIVAHNVVHLRKAAHGSNNELVSQTLLGCLVTVVETEERWSLVETDDAYRGWAESRWLIDPDGRDWTSTTAVFSELRAEPHPGAPLIARLPILNRVHVEGSERGGYVPVQLPGGNVRGYLRATDLTPLPKVPPAEIGAHAAARGVEFLGTPYLWGGSSSYGLDCSGFVQLCYRLSGLTLRRDADIQRDDPRFGPVKHDDFKPGDLVFFGRPDRITHVGMVFGPGKFIHSSGGDGVNIAEIGHERHWKTFVDARRLDPARAGDKVTRAPVPAHRNTPPADAAGSAEERG